VSILNDLKRTKVIPEVQTLCLSFCEWRPRFIQRLPFLSPRNILFTYLFTYPVRRIKNNTDMKIILILFSFCLAVEIEGEKIGETSRKSRSRNRTDRDKRKLEKKTLRLVKKLEKTQVRPPYTRNLMKKGTLFYSGSWYRLQGF